MKILSLIAFVLMLPFGTYKKEDQATLTIVIPTTSGMPTLAWEKVPGQLRQVSVGKDGLVWGVNNDQNIFRYNGSGWTQVGGNLTHVSVASDGAVWGVNNGGEIFRLVNK